MVYNPTYTEEPSPETDAAWDSMFPKGVGFVKHPEVSPNLSGLAVFHELHCVVSDPEHRLSTNNDTTPTPIATRRGPKLTVPFPPLEYVAGGLLRSPERQPRGYATRPRPQQTAGPAQPAALFRLPPPIPDV